jgi:hypothetical protein
VVDQFRFVIELLDVPDFEAMLRKLAQCVVERAGYGSASVADLVATLQSALEEMKAEGVRECDVQFRADGSRLTITVGFRNGREWRIARPLPAAD